MKTTNTLTSSIFYKAVGIFSLLMSLKILSLDIQNIKFNPIFHFPLYPVQLTYPAFLFIHGLLIIGAITLIIGKKQSIGNICLSIGHLLLLTYDPLAYTDAQYMLLWISIIGLPFFSNKVLLLKTLYITSMTYQGINRLLSAQWISGNTLISYKNAFYTGHSIFTPILSNPTIQTILIWLIPLLQLSTLLLLHPSLKKKHLLISLIGFHIVLFSLFCIFHRDPYIQYSQLISGLLLLAWVPLENLKSWIQKKITLTTDSNTESPQNSTKKVTSIVVLIVLVIQILIPASVYLQKNNPNWTDRGAWASWRMKLNVTKIRCLIAVRNPATNQIWYNNTAQDLDRKTSSYQATPYAIWHYTQFLKQKYTKAGMPNIEIYVKLQKSVNGSPYYDLIDPTINMANQSYYFIKENKWILSKPN